MIRLARPFLQRITLGPVMSPKLHIPCVSVPVARSPHFRGVASVLLIGLLALLPGCGGKVRSANLELRRENQALKAEVREVRGQLDQRLRQIEVLEQQVGSPAAVEGADPPRAVSLRLGRYSGPIDANDDGGDDAIRLYVQPRDQHDRFVPIAARATVHVAWIQSDAEQVLVAERSWSPTEFDQAYRSGLMGSHFTLEVPLPAADDLDPAVALDVLTARVTLVDGATGARLTTQQAWPVHLKPTANASGRDEKEPRTQ